VSAVGCRSRVFALLCALWFVVRYALRFACRRVLRWGFPCGCAGLWVWAFFDISVCVGDLS
jgi:hypothetical protein